MLFLPEGGKREGRALARCSHSTSLAHPERIEHDVRKGRFVEHTLQLAIQTCQDVAPHIVSDERLGEPRTNHELFDPSASAGGIDRGLARKLRRAIGFRNVLVHGQHQYIFGVVISRQPSILRSSVTSSSIDSTIVGVCRRCPRAAVKIRCPLLCGPVGAKEGVELGPVAVGELTDASDGGAEGAAIEVRVGVEDHREADFTVASMLAGDMFLPAALMISSFLRSTMRT